METIAAVPVKFKRRKVSAVRDFPEGCGPNVAPITPKKRPAEEPPDDPAGSPAPLSEVHVAPPLKTPKHELLVEASNCQEAPLKEKAVLENGKVPYPLPDASVKLELANVSNGISDQSEKSSAVTRVDVAEKQCFSKLYPPPKRRKVSAIREFPADCGPNALLLKKNENLNRDENVGVAAASAPSESLGRKKVPLANQQAEMDCEGSGGVAHIQRVEREVAKGDSKQVSDGLKGTSSKDPACAPLKSKSMDGEKKTLVKQQLAPEGSIKATNLQKTEGEVAKDDSERIPDGFKGTSSEETAKIAPASLKSKSMDGEKKPMVKQKPALEGSIKVASADKSQGEVKRNDAKKIREKAQETSNEAQVASASKSGLGENTVGEHSNKKVLMRSTPEKKLEVCEETRSDTRVKSSPKSGLGEKPAEDHKEKKVQARSTSEKNLDGRDMKQVSKSLLVKQASDTKPPLDTKSQSGSKAGLKEASSSAGKMKEKYESDTKLSKRKFSEEAERKKPIARGPMEGNLPLVVYGDRVIVQALMAAQNCPWRQGRNSGGVNSRSATPKNNVKKERKSLSNSAIKGAAASQLMDEMFTENEEDSVMHGEEDEKAIVLYNNPREHSITVPPLVPPKHESKGSDDELSARNKVKRTLRLFQLLTRKFVQGEESKTMEFGKKRVDLTAAEILKNNNECVSPGKVIIGHVPGVEVGDEFHYRVELSLVGLHRPYQGGIDFTKRNRINVAISIVSTSGHSDDMDSSDVLIYSGSGGNPVGGDKQAGDQKLERGNLALKNCIDTGTPVRVIHGFKEARALSTFTYDGLYVVEKYWKEQGRNGFSVFKFQLRRMAGQPELSLKEVKRSKKSKVREGLCIKDISEGKESMPICAVNTIDDDRPVPFKYTTKNIYPSWRVNTLPRGCDCTDGCSDSEKCACATKNGGEIPFNHNGAIVQAKPLVYECGSTCKCPPSCPNRVSQYGIKIPLEIFKTESRGWGVRSLYSIPSGSFICEYIGELLKDAEAEQRSNDEYLFDIGHNYEDKTLWEGLPSFIPGLQASSHCETVDDVGFTIDAAEFGNIGRFINHSCSPNIYAQNVLYDHDDKRMPHIMFFAADNIPPLQELTYHYNYTVDQVHDSEGNIKRKNCYCGAPECTGRLY